MAYELVKLAPGSYGVLRDGEPVAALVRTGVSAAVWVAELLADLLPAQRPAPFTELEHEFASVGEVRRWLGLAGQAADATSSENGRGC